MDMSISKERTDLIMKAVVDMKGDWKTSIQNRLYQNSGNGGCIFSDAEGYWATNSTWQKLCSGDRANYGELTPMCTISEFEEAASKWKEQQTVEAPKLQSLLNTKLDCRKPDGTVDEELSRAFQEACFEQGILWCGQYKDIRYLSSPFLFAEPDGCLGYTNIESEKFFNEFVSCKQINFKYYRTLTWEATKVEPDIIAEDKMVDICGVEYSAKELKEALDLISKAKK